MIYLNQQIKSLCKTLINLHAFFTSLVLSLCMIGIEITTVLSHSNDVALMNNKRLDDITKFCLSFLTLVGRN